MSPLSLGAIASVALGGAAALGAPGEALSRGILLGTLLGAAAASASLLAEKRLMLRQPERMFQALGAGFLLKLFLAIGIGCCLRFVEPLSSFADWQGFLVAFPLACLVVIGFGVFDLHSHLRREGAR